MKIRTRLALYFTGSVAIILLFFSYGLIYSVKENRHERFVRKIRNRAITNAHLLFTVRAIDIKLLKQIDSSTINELFDEQISIYNAKNVCIYKNYDHTKPLINPLEFQILKQNKEYFRQDNKYDLIGLIYSNKTTQYTVVVKAFDRYGFQYIRNLKITVWLGFALSLILTLILSYFFADRALKPIKNIIAEARKITANKLEIRINEGNGKDEISHLAKTFNRMLSRIQNSFITQKIFLASASHELRTPITAIKGEIEVALFKERSNEEYKNILHSVLIEIDSLTNLTNDLLELSQTSLDFSDTKQSKIRIDEILIIAQHEATIKHHSAKIKISFNELPENEDELTVLGNENLLRIAFRNLIDNACKFSNLEPVLVSIEVCKKNICISIIDKGIGIKDEDKEQIFNEFFRARNAQQFKGQGIGLALVRKIIEIHKGQIEVESILGTGTTFNVILPHIF